MDILIGTLVLAVIVGVFMRLGEIHETLKKLREDR